MPSGTSIVISYCMAIRNVPLSSIAPAMSFGVQVSVRLSSRSSAGQVCSAAGKEIRPLALVPDQEIGPCDVTYV